MKLPVADSYGLGSFIMFNAIASILVFLIIWVISGFALSLFYILTGTGPAAGGIQGYVIGQIFPLLFILGIYATTAAVLLTTIGVVYALVMWLVSREKRLVISKKVAIAIIGITAV